MTIENYLDDLKIQQTNLANNLTTKGIPSSASELFNSLVPKVLQIQTSDPNLHDNSGLIDILFQNSSGVIDPNGYFRASVSGFELKPQAKNIRDIYIPEITGEFSFLRNCSYLETLGNISFPNCAGVNSDRGDGLFSGNSKLVSVGNIDLSSCTNFYKLFANCSKLETVGEIKVKDFAPLEIVNCSQMFYGTNITEFNYPFNQNARVSLFDALSNCPNLETISDIMAPIQSFRITGSTALKNVGEITCGYITSDNNFSCTFSGCNNLESFGGFTDIKINFSWGLPDVANKEEICLSLANSMATITGKTLTLINGATLPESARTIITGKGWTISESV